jgi:hypoxanthine phosphoribosyltransferase
MDALITKKKLQAGIKKLGRQIAHDYKGKDPIFLGILKGSFIFMADLIRAADIECEVDFMGVASYGRNKRSSGVVRLIKDINVNVTGRHVLIVEDIIDSGLTGDYIMRYIQLRKPKSVEFVTLLDKKTARKVDLNIKYVGFDIPEVFVVGYGLDYNEKYRQLPYIAKG